MPTYVYIGENDFVNTSYGIYAKKGDTIYTNYVIPKDWNEFILLDINNPEPVLPHTIDISVDNNNYILNYINYNLIKIYLKNYNDTILKLKFMDITYNKEIILDNFSRFYVIDKSCSLYCNLSLNTIYLLSENGVANVRISVS